MDNAHDAWRRQWLEAADAAGRLARAQRLASRTCFTCAGRGWITPQDGPKVRCPACRVAGPPRPAPQLGELAEDHPRGICPECGRPR